MSKLGKLKYVFLGVLFFVAFAFPLISNGFGISPPFFTADNLVRGSTYSQTVFLVNGQPDYDVGISTGLNLPESIKNWVTLDSGLDFVIPKGVRQFPVKITVTVPPAAKLGAYTGDITFTTKPPKLGQVTFAMGVKVNVSLTIGTGIYHKFGIDLVRFLDIEQGWDPKVSFRYKNEGNVSEVIDGANFELLDRFGATRLAYIQKTRTESPGDFQEVSGFTQKENNIIDFPVGFNLGLGEYWASVAFYKDNKIIATQKTIFHVLEKGTLSNPLKQFIAFVGDNMLYFIGILIILGGAVWFYLKRRRKK